MDGHGTGAVAGPGRGRDADGWPAGGDGYAGGGGSGVLGRPDDGHGLDRAERDAAAWPVDGFHPGGPAEAAPRAGLTRGDPGDRPATGPGWPPRPAAPLGAPGPPPGPAGDRAGVLPAPATAPAPDRAGPGPATGLTGDRAGALPGRPGAFPVAAEDRAGALAGRPGPLAGPAGGPGGRVAVLPGADPRVGDRVAAGDLLEREAGRRARPPGDVRERGSERPRRAGRRAGDPAAHPPRAVVRRRRARRRALEWPVLIVFALLSAYLIRAYVVQTFFIPSGSMHETLLEGDRVLVNKVSYRIGDVSRGDVVVFRRPPDFPVEEDDLIKRVVGLPGETVEGRGGTVYVDGAPLEEPYVAPTCNGTRDFEPVTVPADRLWVMGDNRCNSSDSRVFGTIEDDLVVGRAFVLAWPVGRLSWL